jgi:hypothetical protein
MKKITFMTRLLFLLLCITVLACKKEAESLDPEMDFKLRLLNDKGVESTSFKEGEKFWLSFLITSKIDETRFFYPNDLTNNKTLFRIGKSDGSSDLGQPYESVICTGQKIMINGKETLELRVPWHSDSAVSRNAFCVQSIKKESPLKGSYKTIFDGFLGVGMLESTRLTKKISLSVNFEIK